MGLTQDLVDARGKLKHAQKKMKDVLDAAGEELDLNKVPAELLDGSDTTAKAEQVRALKKEIEDTHDSVVSLAEAVTALKMDLDDDGQNRKDRGVILPGGHGGEGGGGGHVKTLGQMIVESVAYTGKKGSPIGPQATINLPENTAQMKTLMTTSTGWTIQNVRGPVVLDLLQPRLSTIDLIPVGRTGQTAVVYMEETTVTNAATEVAEAGLYPEAALALTEKQSPVRKIAVWLPVTDEQLEDVPGIAGYIDRRLTFMIRQRLNRQISLGNATGVNLRGLANVVGIQTLDATALDTLDAIYMAMNNVETIGFSSPTAGLVNSTDWMNIKLQKTADGIYIWGNPADVSPDRAWGLPIVYDFTVPQGTAYVGDFANATELTIKRDVDVQITNSHSDNFINGIQAIRADMRAAFTVFRPSAFVQIQNIQP